MYSVRNEIQDLGFAGLQVKKVVTSNTLEILAIALEKGQVFPEHISPRDAHLIVLNGHIEFRIDGSDYKIGQLQQFDFPAEVKHSVLALENSKFLIIR